MTILKAATSDQNMSPQTASTRRFCTERQVTSLHARWLAHLPAANDACHPGRSCSSCPGPNFLGKFELPRRTTSNWTKTFGHHSHCSPSSTSCHAEWSLPNFTERDCTSSTRWHPFQIIMVSFREMFLETVFFAAGKISPGTFWFRCQLLLSLGMWKLADQLTKPSLRQQPPPEFPAQLQR